MTSSSNKLVDKYQYNQSQIKVEGSVQIITAKHIVLKEYYTLKKINISHPKTLIKYHGILNEVNILKAIGNSVHIFKCHKMLKTSSNLYVVYDLMSKNPTLFKYFQDNPLVDFEKKKLISLQLITFLKELRSKNIFFLAFDMKNIEINNQTEIKFLNLQSALISNKNASSYFFQNIQITENLSPQLVQFVQSCNLPYEKDIDFNLFSERLDKADIYALGKIFQIIYKNELKNFVQKKGNGIQSNQSFQSVFKPLVQKMTSKSVEQRVNLEDIQMIFKDKKTDSKKIKIKISRFDTNTSKKQLGVTQSSKSASRLMTSKVEITKSFLSPRQQDDFDRKSITSIKSSGEYTSSPTMKLKKRKGSFNAESESSAEQQYKSLVLKIIKRRNLCKFLLKLAKIVFQLQIIDQTQRIILSFMLIKKSVLLICNLARYISTGKGQTQQFDFKDDIRKQFSKTNDFFKLSLSINKQMDSARNLFQFTINQIKAQFFQQINSIKEFSFNYECKSPNLNEKFMKHLIKKILLQILHKIKSPLTSKNQLQSNKKSANNLLAASTGQKSPSLMNSARLIKQDSKNISQSTKFLQVDDISVSIRSTRTIKSNLSGSSQLQEIRATAQSFDNQFILRNIQLGNLVHIYLMGLILDFQTYEKVFQNLIEDEKLQFQDQSLWKKLIKMQPKDLAMKINVISH